MKRGSLPKKKVFSKRGLEKLERLRQLLELQKKQTQVQGKPAKIKTIPANPLPEPFLLRPPGTKAVQEDKPDSLAGYSAGEIFLCLKDGTLNEEEKRWARKKKFSLMRYIPLDGNRWMY